MHAPRRIPAGWRLFTHLVARATGRFLNADHDPVEGFVPLSRMRAGQYLRDRLRVALPADWPAGPLTVEYGLWKGAVRAPVSVGGAARGDHAEVATVKVTVDGAGAGAP